MSFHSVGFSSSVAQLFFAALSTVHSGAETSRWKTIQDGEEGIFGQMSPQSTDVRLRDTVVHQDARGGTLQSLMVLSGAPGSGTGAGFSAIWRDHRDGMMGLYLGRFSAGGESLEPERPIHHPHSGRRFDPAVALAPDGSGAVMWDAPVPGTPPLAWLRCFDTQGKFLTDDLSLSEMHAEPVPSERAPRSAGASRPSIAHLPKGGWVAAWTEAGKVRYLETDPGGDPRGGQVVISNAKAEPGARLAVDRRGNVLCLWRTSEGTFAVVPAHHEGAPQACGAGDLVAFQSDLASSGYWALFVVESRPVLRHLSVEGKVDRPESKPVDRNLRSVDLAVVDALPALLLGELEGKLAVLLLDKNGGVRDADAIGVPSADARGVADGRIASNGTTLFVAWTDTRNGDPDVYGRSIDPKAPPEARLGPERRLNTDSVSADQTSPALASSGDRGVVTWQDARNGGPQVYARLVSWPGGLAPKEFRLPVAAADAPDPGACTNQAAAMRPDGSFAALWVEPRGRNARLVAQILAPDAQASCAPVEIDAGAEGALPRSSVLVALPSDGGYTIVWTRTGSGGTWARRLAPDGSLPGPARRVSENADGETNEPSIALLDDRRIAAVWTLRRPDGAILLRGRFLDADGNPSGAEIAFDGAGRGRDWDPAVAPAANNGFAMTWTAGPLDDTTPDVVARVYDSHGKPVGPVLPISPRLNEQDNSQIARLSDKTVVVAWEDDISGYDQTYVRRIPKSGKDLGTIVRLNELETKSVIDRQAPVIAPLSDGLLAVWIERRRSQGWDIYLRIMGPRFDEPKKR